MKRLTLALLLVMVMVCSVFITGLTASKIGGDLS